MRNQIIQLALIIGAFLSPQAALANLEEGVGTWRGEGATYAPDGTVWEEYELEAVKVMVDPSTLETTVTQRFPDGKSVVVTQRQTENDHGVDVVGDGMAGASMNLGVGMGHATFSAGDGFRVYMALVRDDDVLRSVKTVVRDGEVFAVVREVVRRVRA